MRNFKSLSSYNLARRGKVYIVENDEDFENGKSQLLGTTVVIDGVTHKVIGIESHAIPTIWKGSKIGLLVNGE